MAQKKIEHWTKLPVPYLDETYYMPEELQCFINSSEVKKEPYGYVVNWQLVNYVDVMFTRATMTMRVTYYMYDNKQLKGYFK